MMHLEIYIKVRQKINRFFNRGRTFTDFYRFLLDATNYFNRLSSQQKSNVILVQHYQKHFSF